MVNPSEVRVLFTQSRLQVAAGEEPPHSNWPRRKNRVPQLLASSAP
jgi:hypothetical protein